MHGHTAVTVVDDEATTIKLVDSLNNRISDAADEYTYVRRQRYTNFVGCTRIIFANWDADKGLYHVDYSDTESYDNPYQLCFSYDAVILSTVDLYDQVHHITIIGLDKQAMYDELHDIVHRLQDHSLIIK
jgi:hypothetical protein